MDQCQNVIEVVGHIGCRLCVCVCVFVCVFVCVCVCVCLYFCLSQPESDARMDIT